MSRICKASLAGIDVLVLPGRFVSNSTFLYFVSVPKGKKFDFGKFVVQVPQRLYGLDELKLNGI